MIKCPSCGKECQNNGILTHLHLAHPAGKWELEHVIAWKHLLKEFCEGKDKKLKEVRKKFYKKRDKELEKLTELREDNKQLHKRIRKDKEFFESQQALDKETVNKDFRILIRGLISGREEETPKESNALKVCSGFLGPEGHEEVYYAGSTCPACSLIKEIGRLEDKIVKLEGENRKVIDQLTERG